MFIVIRAAGKYTKALCVGVYDSQKHAIRVANDYVLDNSGCLDLRVYDTAYLPLAYRKLVGSREV